MIPLGGAIPIPLSGTMKMAYSARRSWSFESMLVTKLELGNELNELNK